MSYQQFICRYILYLNYQIYLFLDFILSEEDKKTEKSIRFWFRIFDLDQNEIIS